MTKAMFDRLSPGLNGHFLIRLLIVSYFIALSIGLIDGTDMSMLTSPFLPALPASIAANAGVIALSALILFGVHRRIAALLLALCLFWCSYLGSLGHVGTVDVGAFWRDLALIGALLLTYSDGNRLALGSYALPEGGLLEPSAQANEQDNPSMKDTPKRQLSKKSLYRNDLDLVRAQ